MAVLVAYASRHGATRGIAERIARRLLAHGLEADLGEVSNVDDLSRYDGVVVGSAVYYGSWMKEAAAFIDEHRALLTERPVWLFGSGPLDGTGAMEEKAMARLHEAIRPRDTRIFAGALDRAKLGFAERIVAKAVRAPDGDYRDWDAIDAWADTIALELAALQTPVPR